MKFNVFSLGVVCTALAGMACFVSISHAQTSPIAKIKDGDKIKVAFSRYDTRGREVYVANTEMLDSSVSATDKNYTWSSSISATTYIRDTHVAVERVMPDGKKEVFADKDQLKWFPAGGDFSKLTPGEQVIRNPRCGEGTFKYTPSSQAAKYKLTIAGKEQELDVQDVTLKGRWAFGSCGSGEQVIRFVYSPQLDFVLERDLKSFQSNGFLSSGNLLKLTAVN